MGHGNASSIDVLKVFFLNNYDPAWRTNANVFISLHTDDPGVGGNQLTHEAAYTSYDRVQVAKTAVGWTLDGTSYKNAAAIIFSKCTGSSSLVTHVAIGTVDKVTGAGQILFSGALGEPLAVSNLIQPQFEPNALVAGEA